MRSYTLYISSIVLLIYLISTLEASSAQQLNICTMLGDNPLPFTTTEFCSSSGLDQPAVSSGSGCMLLGIMEEQLQSMPGTAPECTAARQTPSVNIDPDGTPLPQPLIDQRPLPPKLNTSLLLQEGASLYWHYKNLHNFALWSSCATRNTNQTVTAGSVILPKAAQQWLKPAGWRVVSTLWLQGDKTPAGGVSNTPFAVVMTKGAMMTVLMRGSKTVRDWMADFEYMQVRSGSNALNLPGRVHSGFHRIARYLWNSGIKPALDSEVLTAGSTITSVTFAGHSLGAGVATILSYASQAYINRQRAKCTGKCTQAAVKVDAVLLAPPNVGDTPFVSAFNKLVNARRMAFQYDLIPQVPCSPSMAACPTTPIPTPNPDNSGTWQYSSIGGGVVITPTDMPHQTEAWSKFGQLYPCKVAQYLSATHSCSYACYLSSFVKDKNNMCLLYDKAIRGGEGSYCMSSAASFPDPDHYPFA